MSANIIPSSVLFIGIPSIGGIRSLTWSDIRDANPADFDVLVVDCASLLNFIDIEKMPDTDFQKLLGDLDHLSSRVAKLVASNGTAVFICQDRRRPSRLPGFDCLSWLPIHFDVVPQKGKTLEVLDEGWGRYLSKMRGWDFVFNIGSSAPVWGPRVKIPWEGVLPGWTVLSASILPIALNRADEMVAVEARINFGNTPFGKLSQTGSLILVPAPKVGPVEDAIKLWLEDALGISFSTEAPSWAEDVPIPGLDDIQTKIAEAQQQIAKTENAVKALLEEKTNISRWRGLVYETGTTLQVLCQEAFQALGARIEPSDVSDEFIVLVDGDEILVEVKGVGKSATKGHLGQVLTDAEQREGGRTFAKIALVVNAWRDYPLSERGTSEKPWFPANIEQMAKTAGVVLISTFDLLEALRRHWTSGDGTNLLRRMKETEGRFQLP